MLQGLTGAALATTLFKPGTARALGRGKEPEDFATALRPVPTIRGSPSSEGYWNHVRNAFALPDNYIHMNTGTTGSQPLFSINNLIVYNMFKSLDPRDWEANLAAAFPDLYVQAPSRIAKLQAEIAAMYGANPDEIVLSYNTSHGLQIVFNGIHWNAGDRIVTTQMEHAAGVGPMAAVRDGYGVKLAIVDIPSHFDMSVNEFVDLFRGFRIPLGFAHSRSEVQDVPDSLQPLQGPQRSQPVRGPFYGPEPGPGRPRRGVAEDLHPNHHLARQDERPGHRRQPCRVPHLDARDVQRQERDRRDIPRDHQGHRRNRSSPALRTVPPKGPGGIFRPASPFARCPGVIAR